MGGTGTGTAATAAVTGGGLITAPAIEPISLTTLKLHLRLDSGTLEDNTDSTQCLSYASHAIADNYTTHVGTGVDVLGKRVLVELHCGTNAATGTNDTKIQESDDNTNWTDWTGGAFTQVTTANDNADYNIEYTGTKQYIRTASKVLLAACIFGTSILEVAPTSAEDDQLTRDITTARQEVENDTRRALITQTWDYCLDAFPASGAFKLPLGNLSDVSYIKYRDSAGDYTTMTVTTDYLVEKNGNQCGRILLPYGKSWPSFTAYPSKPISVRYICGYGTTAASVPEIAKSAIKHLCAKYHESRGEDIIGQSVYEDKTYNRLIWKIPRLFDEFI